MYKLYWDIAVTFISTLRWWLKPRYVPRRYLYNDKTPWMQHFTLRWHHNERDGVSNHKPHGCLLYRLLRRKSKKTSKLCVTGLCEGNSPVTAEFPAQRASNAENVSIWWRHHDTSISVTSDLPTTEISWRVVPLNSQTVCTVLLFPSLSELSWMMHDVSKTVRIFVSEYLWYYVINSIKLRLNLSPPRGANGNALTVLV